VLNHGGDETGQVGRGQFKAGVGVHFNQPGPEGVVDHEVVSEDLKGALLPSDVQFARDCLDGVCRHLSHLGDHDFLEVALDAAGVHVLLPFRV
jgi:hypothetical protein